MTDLPYPWTLDWARDRWKETLPEETKDRVLAGASLLDTEQAEDSSVRPPWYEVIDLRTLEIQNPRACITAQVFRTTWDEGLERLGINCWNEPLDPYDLALCGDEKETDAWRAYLVLRCAGEL